MDLSVCVAWSCGESKSEAAVIWLGRGPSSLCEHFHLAGIFLSSCTKQQTVSFLSAPLIFEHRRLFDEDCRELNEEALTSHATFTHLKKARHHHQAQTLTMYSAVCNRYCSTACGPCQKVNDCSCVIEWHACGWRLEPVDMMSFFYWAVKLRGKKENEP